MAYLSADGDCSVEIAVTLESVKASGDSVGTCAVGFAGAGGSGGGGGIGRRSGMLSSWSSGVPEPFFARSSKSCHVTGRAELSEGASATATTCVFGARSDLWTMQYVIIGMKKRRSKLTMERTTMTKVVLPKPSGMI